MKISILIPTCFRPSFLARMIQSMEDTCKGHNIEPVFVVDEDSESLSAIQGCWGNDNHILDFSRKKRGALWSWNRALQLSTGDIIVPAGDDQVFHDGWLDYALESHQKQVRGYGVVGMNDLAYDGNTQVATMFIFDRTYCKNEMGGVFAPPMYHYYCIDSEWNEKAKILGRFYWDSRSIVEHLHSAHGKRALDQHDQLKLDSKWAELDNAIFANRKKNGFPIVWESVI